MAERDFNRDLVRVTRTVILKQLSETSVLVTTNAKGIVQIDAFMKFEPNYSCTVTQGAMDVFP